MGGIYEVRRWNGLSYRDKHLKFHKDWFRYAKVHKGDTQKLFLSRLYSLGKKPCQILLRIADSMEETLWKK